MMQRNRVAENDCIPPAETLREIRRRDAYGCVVCGNPICAIVTDNAKTDDFDAAATAKDYMIFCQRHYTEWKTGQLSKKKVKGATLNPYNSQIKPGGSIPFTINPSENIDIKVGAFRMLWEGGGLATGQRALLIVDHLPLFSLGVMDNQLLFSITMLDEYNHNLVTIKDNIISYCSPSVQILYLKDMLTILKNNETVFSLHYHFANKIVLKEARFQISGIRLNIHGNLITVNGEELELPRKIKPNSRAMINIGEKEDYFHSQLHIPNLNRYRDELNS